MSMSKNENKNRLCLRYNPFSRASWRKNEPYPYHE